MLGGRLQLLKNLTYPPFISDLQHTTLLPQIMSTKAPRIQASTWEAYREEVTALYTAPDGTLEKVMDTMKERHGFVTT